LGAKIIVHEAPLTSKYLKIPAWLYCMALKELLKRYHYYHLSGCRRQAANTVRGNQNASRQTCSDKGKSCLLPNVINLSGYRFISMRSIRTRMMGAPRFAHQLCLS